MTDALDPDHAADLRRAHAREISEHLIDLARHLLPDDRDLIEQVYLHQRTAVEMVADAPDAGHDGGDPEKAARALRSRIRRVVRRMLRPEFGYVAHQIETWTPTRRRVARACILHGRPIRAAADELNLSVHTVRRHLDAVQAMYEIDRQRVAGRLRERTGNTWMTAPPRARVC